MKFRREIKAVVVAGLAACLACPPSYALVTLNDSHDHIYVTGGFSVSRDSNIFASSDNEGDFVYGSSLSVTYQRRAGWIGVNAGVSMNASRFGKNTTENFSNPAYSLELTKQSGRTTGSFTLSAAKESRADAAVNLRSESWNYNAGLNFKYPGFLGNIRSTLTGGVNYAGHIYSGNSALANLDTYAANVNFVYLLPYERDLVTGYRYRFSETSRDSSYSDHSVNVGLSGRLLFGLNGNVSAGYQTRQPHGTAANQGSFQSWTASSAVTYPFNKKFQVTGSVAKDFSTTATDSSVDSLTAGLSTQYDYNARWSLSANGSWGDSQFLGEKGRIVLATSPAVILGPHRHDQFLTWGANLNYSRSQHLRLSLGYSWFENWSTIAFADFVRTTWSLTLSSMW